MNLLNNLFSEYVLNNLYVMNTFRSSHRTTTQTSSARRMWRWASPCLSCPCPARNRPHTESRLHTRPLHHLDFLTQLEPNTWKQVNFHCLINILYLSIKALVCQWVSLCVCLFPNSYETANPNELKFWGMIPLGMEKVLG